MIANLLIVVVCVVGSGLCSTQSYKVTGTLRCDDKPMAGVCVKLWNKNIGVDTVMGSCKTDSSGRFSCQGHASEIAGDIKPKLKIYHRCHKTVGYRKVKFELPRDKITHNTAIPSREHAMGDLSLNTKYPGEETELWLGTFGGC